jgi:hypothetical protein
VFQPIRVRSLLHNERMIMELDFSGQETDGSKEMLAEYAFQMASLGPQEQVPVLVDLGSTPYKPSLAQEWWQRLGMLSHRVSRSAILNATPEWKAAFQSFARALEARNQPLGSQRAVFFSGRHEALEFLAPLQDPLGQAQP